jgi:hypothetical protein
MDGFNPCIMAGIAMFMANCSRRVLRQLATERDVAHLHHSNSIFSHSCWPLCLRLHKGNYSANITGRVGAVLH